MRRLTLASCILAAAAFGTLLGCATPTLAARLVEVSVVNRSTGERLTPYRHGGKLYVAGTPGERYAVELKSRSGERLLTVISVDGVNVLTGQTAAAVQSGYVLDAWRSYAINGWRKSMDDVAQFVFTALPDSYAARTGRPDNVGVIGVAVFRERAESVPLLEPWRGGAGPVERDRLGNSAGTGSAERQASKAEAAPAAAARADAAASVAAGQASGALADRHESRAVEPAKRLGTGHGEREHSPTRQTEFVRASDAPAEVVTIYYDSRPNLIARGIIRAPRVAEPAPFPGGIGFVPDPRG